MKMLYSILKDSLIFTRTGEQTAAGHLYIVGSGIHIINLMNHKREKEVYELGLMGIT